MLGYTDDIVSHGSLSARLSAFGWDCLEVDGHDVECLTGSPTANESKLCRQAQGADSPDIERARCARPGKRPALAHHQPQSRS